MTWRDKARPIIARAIHEAAENCMTVAEAKKFISTKYPFGERAMYPYRVWLSEVNRQLTADKKGIATYEAPRPTRKPLAGQKELL